jgi:hypothetical protein
MKLRQQLLACCCLASFATGFAGCGSSGPTTVEVTGTVTYNNSPVAGAAVMFQGGTGRPATGETDSQGKFTLRTFGADDGAVPGEYVVTITKVESVPPGQPGGDAGREPPTSTRTPPKSLIPMKYNDAKTSGLKETVSESGPNDFTFNLTD